MRYAFSGAPKIDRSIDYDVVVIGAGIAGLYTAINLDRRYSCCCITKEGIDLSSSWLAQGGIAAAVAPGDTPFLHFEDTLVAGAGLCDEAAVRVLVDEGPADIRNLVSLHVPFDLTEDGDLSTGREGGHHRNRIVHAGGDATGRETVKVLAHLASQQENISFMPHTFLIDVLTDREGRTAGILVLDSDDKYVIVRSRNVVMATGGIGQVYVSSTNPKVATGDGIAAAVRAGAAFKHAEFIQFHPTGLYSRSTDGNHRAFLISEAVRGDGGLLKNKDGVRFMLGAHELNELAPRDIVARAIVREMERSGEDHVYVDITAEPEEFLSHRFPTIYKECLSRGINISKDWIPVCPVQHYLIGGVETDLDAQTVIPGLYMCGEAACTGVHGANRLASNSMLECLVFGRRAAASINARLDAGVSHCEDIDLNVPARPEEELDLAPIRARVQAIMTADCGVIRTKERLLYAQGEISALLDELTRHFSGTRDYYELLNILTLARIILGSALARKESVGAHYREN